MKAALGEVVVVHEEDFFQRNGYYPLQGAAQEVMEAASLQMYKERLHVALSGIVWLTSWCWITGWPRWSFRSFPTKLILPSRLYYPPQGGGPLVSGEATLALCKILG